MKHNFIDMILENLKTAGVQQAYKEDKITFSSIVPWPGYRVGLRAEVEPPLVPVYQRALRIASELREARSLAEQSRRTSNDLFTTRSTDVHISSALATDDMRFGCKTCGSTHGLCCQLLFGA